MAEQYFSRRPPPRRPPAEVRVSIRGHGFVFTSDAGVFSRGRLDRGTELLLEALDLGACESVLDLGCGYGVVGIVADRLSGGGRAVPPRLRKRPPPPPRRRPPVRPHPVHPPPPGGAGHR